MEADPGLGDPFEPGGELEPEIRLWHQGAELLGERRRSPDRPNNNGNDGTIARFGWKRKQCRCCCFRPKAYNVRDGHHQRDLPNERDETANCQFATTPNDIQNLDAVTPKRRHRDPGVSRTSCASSRRPRPSPDTPGGRDRRSSNGKKLVQPTSAARVPRTTSFMRTRCSPLERRLASIWFTLVRYVWFNIPIALSIWLFGAG